MSRAPVRAVAWALGLALAVPAAGCGSGGGNGDGDGDGEAARADREKAAFVERAEGECRKSLERRRALEEAVLDASAGPPAGRALDRLAESYDDLVVALQRNQPAKDRVALRAYLNRLGGAATYVRVAGSAAARRGAAAGAEQEGGFRLANQELREARTLARDYGFEACAPPELGIQSE